MRTRIASLSGLPFIAVGILAVAGRIAAAQTPAAAAPLPPAKPAVTEKAREKAVPAKTLFGAKALPSVGKSMTPLHSSAADYRRFRSSKIIAEAFSAIIIVGELVFPDVIDGITEASTTRSLSMIPCSVLFFLLSNGAVWAFSGMYPLSLSGLTQCYIAALPFLDKTILGDLFWTGVLFGGAWLVQHRPTLSRRAL